MIDLVPPYPGPDRHAIWHEHFDKRGGRWSFDAVEDDLRRIFVWDAEHEHVVQMCSDRDEAVRVAKRLARG